MGEFIPASAEHIIEENVPASTSRVHSSTAKLRGIIVSSIAVLSNGKFNFTARKV